MLLSITGSKFASRALKTSKKIKKIEGSEENIEFKID